MVVSNLIFDITFFGALLLAVLVDGVLPQTLGMASLIAIGCAVYASTQEWCDFLWHRRQWTQEALSSAVALSALGFIYFWWSNQSDFVLLILSIGLMMASLMLAIAILAAFGAAIKERSAHPVLGLLLTIIGAAFFGISGGVLALFLGTGATPLAQVLVIGLSFLIWKAREMARSPQKNIHASGEAPYGELDNASLNLPATHAPRWALIPRRGTLLDRFIPVLLLGVLLFLIAQQTDLLPLQTPAPTPNTESETLLP